MNVEIEYAGKTLVFPSVARATIGAGIFGLGTHYGIRKSELE